MTAASAYFPLHKFRSRLEEGKTWERHVLDKLVEAGLPATRPGEAAMAGASVREFTTKSKDLVVGNAILEVKSRHGKTQFGEDPQSYPYDTAIIDTKYGFNAKEETPHYYVLVSASTGAILALDVEATKDQWLEGVFYDSYEKARNICYVAPKELLHDFDWLVEELSAKVQEEDRLQRGEGGEVVSGNFAGAGDPVEDGQVDGVGSSGEDG